MKKFLKIFISILGIIFLCSSFIYYQNNYIKINKVKYENDLIDNYTIVQISDLHNMNTHGNLAKKIKKCNPDIIVFTGDISDTKHYDFEGIINEMEQLIDIAPIYYISGNHEKYLDNEKIYSALKNMGIIILNDKSQIINDSINLIGINDPLFETYDNITTQINNFCVNDKINVVLSHRPELFDYYIKTSGDLFLTGHAHGGQWIIPFTKQGLYAPNQGILPKFTEGIHIENNKTMIINRGLGNSGFPLRLFNTPEITSIKFTKR